MLGKGSLIWHVHSLGSTQPPTRDLKLRKKKDNGKGHENGGNSGPRNATKKKATIWSEEGQIKTGGGVSSINDWEKPSMVTHA